MVGARIQHPASIIQQEEAVFDVATIPLALLLPRDGVVTPGPREEAEDRRVVRPRLGARWARRARENVANGASPELVQ